MSEMADSTGKRPQQLLNYPRAPPPFPPPSCPRCYSGNTKFCYYNNYSVTQPRYLCKNCRRYWTLGGVLRYIPTGGNSRKRNRVDSSSSSSPLSIPPPPSGSSDSHNKYRPPARHTTQSFSGGVFFNQTPLKFSPGSEFRGVNNLFHAVNVAPPTPINYGHRESGSIYFQRPQFQPPPPQPPPTVLTGRNVATSNSTTLMGPNNIVSIDRDPAAAANVVNINEWCELNDMENEGDPFQSYKPPPP